MKKVLITSITLLLFSQFLWADCVFHRPVNINELTIGNFISWSTIEEHSNKKFVVEKSEDGITFAAIGELDGAGDSQSVQDYRFLDLNTGVDEAYYRLKMIDLKDYESHTHTIFFHRENSNNYIFKSMSSPITDVHFTLLLDSKNSGKMRYRVVDQKGNVQLSKSQNVKPGENMISINLSSLPIGTYKFQTDMNGEKEALNLRKVKPESLPNIQYVIK